MISNPSFRRKIIYMATIVLLIFPLIYLGAPATTGKQASAGGTLSQMRRDYQLSQAQLGEIDPASESMRLATLGLNGVAANVLWQQANHFQKVEDYDNLSTTLKQITKLQPNFISVWEFQAHNLSYNVSADFDDYRHRYQWVKQGIHFLMDGNQANVDEPRLLWQVGWYMGQKIARSDERASFRRLFRDDDEFHRALDRYVTVFHPSAQGPPPERKPDNWKVGRLWYLVAQDTVTTKGKPLRGKSPLIFHSSPSMSLINYAKDISKEENSEKQGLYDQPARLAWNEALRAWVSYGDQPIQTSWGTILRLNDLDKVNVDIERAEAELEKAAPNVRARLREEKLAKLTPEERAMLTREPTSGEEYDLLMRAEGKTFVKHQEVAMEAPDATRAKAREAADKLEELEEQASRISRYRGIVNFEYWKIRCEAEGTATATDARRLVFDAGKSLNNAELQTAKQQFEAAWDAYAKLFDQYPRLADDVSSEDLYGYIDKYKVVLEQLEEKWPPENFKMQLLLDLKAAREGKAPMSADPANPATPPGDQKTPPADPTKPPADPADPMPSDAAPVQPPVPDGRAPTPGPAPPVPGATPPG